jgi:glycosyltransferase involved in cell wall biosynthesis
MSQSLVSIIIPTHDRLPLLRQALDSVFAQTYRQYEVLVVDDGSTEDIATGVRDHACAPRVLRQFNQGPASARNRGIEAATGEWIAFLDSDDLWLPAKLERFVEAIRKPGAPPIWYGPMTPISSTGEPVTGRTKPCVAGDVTQALFCNSFIHVPTVVCRREVLQEAGGFDERLPVCEDYDLWLRISLKHPFGLIEETLAKRRLHDGRLSKSRMSRNLSVKAEMLRRFYAQPAAKMKIDAAAATRRLAKVYFAAGRAAFRDGRFRTSCEMFAESRRFGLAPARTLPWTIASNALGMFSGADKGESPAATKAVTQSANSV